MNSLVKKLFVFLVLSVTTSRAMEVVVPPAPAGLCDYGLKLWSSSKFKSKTGVTRGRYKEILAIAKECSNAAWVENLILARLEYTYARRIYVRRTVTWFSLADKYGIDASVLKSRVCRFIKKIRTQPGSERFFSFLGCDKGAKRRKTDSEDCLLDEPVFAAAPAVPASAPTGSRVTFDDFPAPGLGAEMAPAGMMFLDWKHEESVAARRSAALMKTPTDYLADISTGEEDDDLVRMAKMAKR